MPSRIGSDFGRAIQIYKAAIGTDLQEVRKQIAAQSLPAESPSREVPKATLCVRLARERSCQGRHRDQARYLRTFDDCSELLRIPAHGIGYDHQRSTHGQRTKDLEYGVDKANRCLLTARIVVNERFNPALRDDPVCRAIMSAHDALWHSCGA